MGVVMSSAANEEKCGQKRPPSPGSVNGGGKKRAFVPTATDEEDVCWLCLDGNLESGEPLRRDCSCRGGSGWAHFSCIVEYAKQKTEEWRARDGMGKFNEPWRECPGCKQDYQNELAIELVNELVSFVEEKYPDDKLKHLEALNSMLYALLPKQKEEIQQIADKILSVVGQMKTADPSLPRLARRIEGHAYNNLGYIAFKEGTNESAKAAVEYFEKYRNICEEIDYAEGVTIAESNVALAKAEFEGRSKENNQELLEKQQKMYKNFAKTHGQEHTATLDAGLNLARELKKAHRGIESERLLTKLTAVSKRAHGPDHKHTKRAESELQKCKVRYVHTNGKKYQALRYEEDGGKCVVQGPIAKPRNIQGEQTFPITYNFLGGLELGTPVVCHGLKVSTHLNYKIGDLRSWEEESGCFKVYFEDKDIEPRAVKLEFLQILFDLPEEL